jgi:hypothetical protein
VVPNELASADTRICGVWYSRKVRIRILRTINNTLLLGHIPNIRRPTNTLRPILGRIQLPIIRIVILTTIRHTLQIRRTPHIQMLTIAAGRLLRLHLPSTHIHIRTVQHTLKRRIIPIEGHLTEAVP